MASRSSTTTAKKKKKSTTPPSPPMETIHGYKKPPGNSQKLEKYRRMMKAGLPQGAIENAMIRDGIHPVSMFDNPLADLTPIDEARSATITANTTSDTEGGF